MALTFPRPMPAGGVDSQAFDLMRSDMTSPRADGRFEGVAVGWPLWRMTLTLNNADADETDVWVAFIDAQRGATRPFLARDLTRPFPKAHPDGFDGMDRAGGGAFDGSATSWSVNADRDVLTLNGLPAGLTLSLRDYVGFRWTTDDEPRRVLTRVVEPASADGSGVLVAAIEPPLPTLTPSDAPAHLDIPDVVMRLIPAETSLGERDVLHTQGGTVTALQDLRD